MGRPAQHGGDSVFIGARPTPAATGLLVAAVVSYLTLVFLHGPLSDWLVAHLGLTPSQALGRHPWQLVTSTFINPSFASFLSDGFGIWVFATAIETQIGRRRMLTLFAVAQLAGAVAVALVGRLLHIDGIVGGCAYGIVGLVVAFGVAYGAVPLRVFGIAELKGRTLALIIVGVGLVIATVNAVFTGDYRALAGQLCGIVAGFAIMGGTLARLDNARQQWKLKRMRRRYKVIPGGRDGRDGERYVN